MLEDLKATEKQILVLEEQFRELTMKEAEIFEQLTEVRAAKLRARRLVAEKRNRYAPIFTLPDELLVSIVEAAQTDSVGALIEVIVSQISQRFRWAVLGASSLWSSIELRWGVKSDEERFAAYLERSRYMSVSVKLRYDSYHGKEGCEYEEVPDGLAMVADHISRIRRLVLHCGGMGLELDDAVIHFNHLYAPCLEYVDICSHPSELNDLEDPYLSIFNGGAPRLTALKLKNVYPIVLSGNPWMALLTSLDLRGIQKQGIYPPTLLASCPQLIDLTLDETTFFTLASDPPADGSISMPSLRALRGFGLESRRLFAGVVAYIHAPALETLEFSWVHGSQISSFFNHLTPSKFPALKSLTFANSSSGCTECQYYPLPRIQPQALRRFSGLASLTIINVCHLNPLLGDLLATSKDAYGGTFCALSALHTLTLRYKDADNFGIASWPRLESASLDPADDPDPLDVLRNLIASLREIRPVHLQLPRSRFFTERDWNRDDPDFEIFDVQPLLRSMGHTEEDEGSELVPLEVY
ncbi:hypothetical protein B0H13DRAFT_1176328 [Mycena leptocephala]|nr:hypothetical protein B0H13DRAFT_1176328 [Mycena leptocephala]